jgi:hypothetical protein
MKAKTIVRWARCAITLAALFAAAATGARADETYTYASQPYSSFYIFVPCPSSNVCGTTGTLTFANPLPANMALQSVTPESYSFTDGVTVLDNTNSSIFNLDLATNSSGQIVAWDYFFTQGNPEIDLFELCGDSSFEGCGLAGRTSGNYNYADQAEYDINDSPNFFIEYAVTGTTPGSWTGGTAGDGNGNGNGNGSGSTNVPEPSVITLLASGGLVLMGIKTRGSR